jgi:hypothetical protein
MKKIIPYFGLLVVLMAGLSCCKEDNTPDMKTSQEMFDCFTKSNWTTDKISATLLGTWEWQHAHQSWGGGATTELEKGLRVTFSANGTYVLTKGTVTTQGTWSVKQQGAELYVMETEPFQFVTMGSILICGNQVLFSHLPADGNDNYFIKVNSGE